MLVLLASYSVIDGFADSVQHQVSSLGALSLVGLLHFAGSLSVSSVGRQLRKV